MVIAGSVCIIQEKFMEIKSFIGNIFLFFD